MILHLNFGPDFNPVETWTSSEGSRHWQTRRWAHFSVEMHFFFHFAPFTHPDLEESDTAVSTIMAP